MLVRLPPSPASAGAARRLAIAAVIAQERPDLSDDIGAVVSELVANAVFHAGTEVEVSIELAGTGVRVAVSDGSGILPHWTPASATATSGRGLILVQRLSSEWGAERDGVGKTVWARIEHAAEVDQDSSVEDLLALWAPDELLPAELPAPTVQVVLTVEVGAMLDSRAHTEDLTRELQLMVLNEYSSRAPARVVRLTHRLAAATAAFHEGRRQILHQTLTAAQQGRPAVTLRLQLRPQDAEAAHQWLAALDEAEMLTAQGILLLPPFSAAMTHFRRHYVHEIIAGLQRVRRLPSDPGAADADAEPQITHPVVPSDGDGPGSARVPDPLPH